MTFLSVTNVRSRRSHCAAGSGLLGLLVAAFFCPSRGWVTVQSPVLQDGEKGCKWRFTEARGGDNADLHVTSAYPQLLGSGIGDPPRMDGQRSNMGTK